MLMIFFPGTEHRHWIWGTFRNHTAKFWDPNPEYTFEAFERRFHLVLEVNSALAEPDFKVSQWTLYEFLTLKVEKLCFMNESLDYLFREKLILNSLEQHTSLPVVNGALTWYVISLSHRFIFWIWVRWKGAENNRFCSDMNWIFFSPSIKKF